jgi:hypothetical protein
MNAWMKGDEIVDVCVVSNGAVQVANSIGIDLNVHG